MSRNYHAVLYQDRDGKRQPAADETTACDQSKEYLIYDADGVLVEATQTLAKIVNATLSS